MRYRSTATFNAFFNSSKETMLEKFGQKVGTPLSRDKITTISADYVWGLPKALKSNLQNTGENMPRRSCVTRRDPKRLGQCGEACVGICAVWLRVAVNTVLYAVYVMYVLYKGCVVYVVFFGMVWEDMLQPPRTTIHLCRGGSGSPFHLCTSCQHGVAEFENFRSICLFWKAFTSPSLPFPYQHLW